MDLIPEKLRHAHPTQPAHQLKLTASAIGVALALALPLRAQAQDSVGGDSTGSSSTGSSSTGASSVTQLGNGLGGSGSGSGNLGAPLSIAAPFGGGFGLGNGVLQNTSLGGGLVNLRDLVNSPAMQSEGRAFSYYASLGVFAGYTDNTALAGFGGATGNGRSSTFERINPTLGASVDLNRLQGSATYAPGFYFYNSDSAADHSYQSLSGQLLFTAVPDTLFVRTSVFGTVASNSQLSAYNGVNQTVTNNSSQVYSYNFNPYFQHSFADVVSAYGGYNFSQSFFESLGNNSVPTTTTTTPFGNTATTSPNNSNSATQSEFLTLTSGPAFTFLQHALSLQAAQYFGQNLRHTGGSDSVAYTLSYAWNRFVSTFGQVGYQNLHYDATSFGGRLASRAYTYNGLTGSGGVKLTPNDLSELTASYGYYDGGDVVTVLGRVQPTPRIVLVANSSTSVSTNGQDLSNYASTSNFAANGAATAPGNGAPTGYSLATPVTNPAPFRVTRSSVSAIYSRDLDSFFSTFSYTSQTAVAAVAGNSTGSSHSILGSLGWQHTVSDTIFLTATGNYGQQTTGASSTGPSVSNPVIGAVVRLTNNITPTIMIEADYIFQHQQVYANTQQPNKVESMNEIYFGATKQF